jgi:hypothetical protein
MLADLRSQVSIKVYSEEAHTGHDGISDLGDVGSDFEPSSVGGSPSEFGPGRHGVSGEGPECFNAFGDESAASGFPKRFVFIRKSNGERPLRLALPTFSANDKAADEKKQPLVVDLSRHELPVYLRGLEKHKANLGILQGLSCTMSENGHYSFSSVMGAYITQGTYCPTF